MRCFRRVCDQLFKFECYFNPFSCCGSVSDSDCDPLSCYFAHADWNADPHSHCDCDSDSDSHSGSSVVERNWDWKWDTD